MKNRIIFCLLALLFWQPVKAQTLEKGDAFIIDYDAYVLKYTVTETNPPYVSVKLEEEPTDDTELSIPEIVTYNDVDYSVTEIASQAFSNVFEFIGDLLIPNTVTKINARAFEGCEGLESVTIPNGVTSIGEAAFSGCSSLSGNLIIPNSVTSIGKTAFSGCKEFTGLTISENIEEIPDHCFSGCSGLQGIVVIPNKVTSIGSEAFYSCQRLTDIILSDNITAIGSYAFYSCKKITNFKLPEELEKIEDGAFSQCNGVSTIIIPNKVTSIGNACFLNCKKLEKITITASEVPELGKVPELDKTEVFEGTKLQKICVPANLYEDYISEDSKNNWRYYKEYIVALPTFINNGEWTEADNWYSSTLPSSNDDVFIYAEATIGHTWKDGKCIYCDSPQSKPTDVVAVINSYSMCSDGSITIKEGGQLIHNEGYGEVTIEKKIEAYVLGEDGYLESGWYTISSAFGEMPVNSLLVNNYELFRYNETIYEWENVKNSENDFSTLESGRGYIYSNENATTLKIIGEPNTNNVVTYNLTAEGELLNGFNLVGNPFTHNIYKGSGASLYNANLTTGYYMLTNAGAWLSKFDTDPILPAQGILVKTSTAGELQIRKNTSGSTRRTSSNGLLTIKVSNNKYEDVAYVTFNGETGLDKIEHRNPNIPMVYIHDNNADYAIAVMEKEVEEIPVYFEHKTLGKYTISVSANDFECQSLLLIDNYENNTVNILEEDYTFLANSNFPPDRFTLKIIPKEKEIVIYTNDNNIVIDNLSGDASINVYDISGRIVTKLHANSNCNISSESLPKGVYIVNVTDEQESKTQKVVVK